MLIAILVPLGLGILVYLYALVRAALAKRATPTMEALALGAVVSFFDTLGIGCFAPTTAWLRFRKLVPDRLIPPTLLVGLTPQAMVQSIIYMTLVPVDPVLLVGCIIANVLGGVIGASLVVRARVWIVQAVVAIGLLLAAIAYTMTNLDLIPGGGTATGLPPLLTTIAIVVNFALGILMNFGVGNYAPMLVMFGLMGMNPQSSFPVMATGASLMGVSSSVKHIGVGQIDLRICLGLAIGGIPAVLVAAFIVKSMPVFWLRWMVVAIVLYTAIVLIRSARIGRREHKAEGATAAVAAP
ncbi:MAG TPA: sulfite exporter TauE/SafE family protein [Allosphingosinicella sp.]|nr:sulfite exporter TauE/SafE family protein [Allosphingosinicella sp.]